MLIVTNLTVKSEQLYHLIQSITLLLINSETLLNELSLQLLIRRTNCR